MSAEQTEFSNAAKQPSRRWLRRFLLLFGPLVLLLGGSYFYITSGRYISTENAYVKADKVAISADVSGRVSAVTVDENDLVTAGQLLFQIDDLPYQLELDRAEAELGLVASEIEALRTAYRQALSSQQMANDNLEFAQREYERQQKLSKRGIVSKAHGDEARRNLQLAQRQLVTIQEDITLALVKLGGDVNLDAKYHPRYLKARADRDKAALDLQRTQIKAPHDGIISNMQLQVGEYVAAGKPIFSLVVASDLWITANLKETELTHIRSGQTAIVSADTYPDFQWQAEVVSISPATGAEFSLLPPQNATGNWVKVVQRIPVRLNLLQPDSGPPLRVGMSVQVKIDSQYERPLPGVIRTALAWFEQSEPRRRQSLGATLKNQ